MTVASVTPLARGRKPRRPDAKLAGARQRLDAKIAQASTPGHVVAAALDYLRIALAIVARTDPQAANAAAWQIHRELVAHADRLIARRRTEDTDNSVLRSNRLQGRSN